MIINSTPITTGTFSGMWVTNLVVVFPSAERPKGMIDGTLLPYDGTNLLATSGAKVSISDLTAARATDPVLSGVVMNLASECKRQAVKTSSPILLSVSAATPASPVTAMLGFADGTSHVIPDCFALCGTDQVFAGVFMAVMGEIARQAGLEIE